MTFATTSYTTFGMASREVAHFLLLQNSCRQTAKPFPGLRKSRSLAAPRIRDDRGLAGAKDADDIDQQGNDRQHAEYQRLREVDPKEGIHRLVKSTHHLGAEALAKTRMRKTYPADDCRLASTLRSTALRILKRVS